MNVDFIPLGQVAVVDDTAVNLRILSGILENVGYDVRPFPTGISALEGITDSPPELILLDIQMPGLNGYELCKKLKANESTKHIPVIFISALNETFDKVKAFQIGGVDYITKPFQSDEVLARVATHLELYQIKRQLQKSNSLQAEQLAEQNIQLLNLNQSLEQTNQELKHHYTQLEQTQLQLVQTEKMAMLGNLIAGIAHEINNPVGFLRGNLKPAQKYIQDLLALIDFLRTKTPTGDQQIQDKIVETDFDFIREDLPTLLKSMNVGVDRIREISNSLRTFSRQDQDRKIAFDIHKGIDSTLLILKHRTKANRQRPDIEVVKNYGNLPEVHCFPGPLNQVFMNILANAIDAFEETNRGKSVAEIKANPNVIRIQTSCTDTAVEIQIQDNGCGMKQDVTERLFEQGFTTKEVGKGTGLGMAIARQIVVDAHNGSLDVQSEVGQGTEFRIRLPL